MSKFVHLHVHSHYSLLDGLTRIEEIVATAKEFGQPAVALTDHGVMYGAIEFYQACKKAGVKPIIGLEAYLAPRNRRDREKQADERAYSHLILLAKNLVGYKNLLQLTTKAHLEGFYYKPRIDWEILDQHGDGLIVLTACMGGEIPRLLLNGRDAEAEVLVQRYQKRFGDDFYIELQRRNNIPELTQLNMKMLALARKYKVGIVATNDVHYLKTEDAEAHDVVLCLQTKAKQSDTDRLTMLGENYCLRSSEDIALLFEDLSEAIDNTVAIAEKCNIELELGKIKLPKFPLPEGESHESYLQKLCEAGLEHRYGGAHPPEPPLSAYGGSVGGGENKNFSPSHREGERERLPPFLKGGAGGGCTSVQGVGGVTIEQARERLQYELSVIAQMGLSPYFLIVQDFVNWAKQQGIVVGPGRGSAAGSIVSYLTNITNLDPLRYGLLFERFLTPGRIQMPDIDLDFADHRRDEVIQYVRGKYGDDRVAQIITFGTMAARASIRDVGRVLDVPLHFCDRLAKLIPMQSSLDEAMKDVPELHDLIEADPTTQHLFAIAKRVEGLARHTSTHACGVVIAADPLVTNLPIQHASADDATIVTQYEMHAVETLGLLKMDFLGLSNLSIIEHAVNTIRVRGGTVDVDHLPENDQAAYALLQAGKSTGVFQLESGGMKRYLKELKPSQFEDIIAMVALYRPGPMELIPEYIDRKFGRKPITYLHPKLEPILKNTYGIMVYQEQLMQLARELAGFSMAQADTLRKAVGKKIKSLLDEQRGKLIEGMIAYGILPKIAEKIWEWIEPFARYGFNRSHAACYAFIAYQTAYLKAHFPAEFMAALLTAERGDVDRLAVLIQECREMRITVLGPDVNESEALFTVTPSAVDESTNGHESAKIRDIRVHSQIRSPHSCIRFGLAAIKNVGEHLIEALMAERKAHGLFRDLPDLLARVRDKDFNKKSLESLIRAGVLDRFGERGRLLANIDTLLAYSREIGRDAESGQENLFGGLGRRVELRLASADPAPQRMQLAWEKELLGLYLSAHPFTVTAQIIGTSLISVAEVKNPPPHKASEGQGGGSRSVVFGGVLTRIKRIVTKKGEGMLFAEVEDATGAVEIVVFPRILTATAQAWIPETSVLIRGNVSDKDGEPKVLADHAVQVIAGQERDAMRLIEGTVAYAFERSGPRTRIVLTLPDGLPSEKLLDLRGILSRSPGRDAVFLRTVVGRIVSTGVRVTLTPELRTQLQEILGTGAIVEEEERAIA